MTKCKVIIVLLILITCNSSFSQIKKIISLINKKPESSFTAGGGAGLFYIFDNNRHFKTDTVTYEREIMLITDYHGNMAGTYFPKMSYHAEADYRLKVNKYFTAGAGILFQVMSYGINKLNDTALRTMVNNYNIRNSYPLDLDEKITITDFYISIPLSASFTFKRFTAELVATMMLLDFNRQRSLKLDGSTVDQWHTYSEFGSIYDFKDILDIEDNFIPTLKLKYLINKKHLPVSLYLKATRMYAKAHDFQLGIELGFGKIERKN